MTDSTKPVLPESEIPKAWYNINADIPVAPAPVLHPQTMEPVTPDFLSVLFPMSLIMQEISTERYIEIPEPVRDIYRLWRPTPLFRARRLEKALDTPAHIYYKYEGVSPVGSHKPNTSVPQALRPSPLKLAPGSGVLPWQWPAICSTWTWKCTWSRSLTSKSHTGAS